MYSLSPSESSSSDSLSLPLPASPQHSSFAADVWQKDGHFRVGGRPTATETVPWWSGGVSAFVPALFIIILFPLSTMLVFAGLFTLPITASFPRTLHELAQLGLELQAYSESGLRPQAHVLGILSLTALWKHAWSIPGSALLNALAGVLLSPISATLLMTALTAIGSVLSTLLATPLAPVISHVFPKAVALTRSALEGGDALTSPRERSPVWVRLSVLRLIGVVPWSGINIACGVASVALFDCLLGAFIGTLPWTAVTCQVGDIVQTVASTSGSGSSQTITSVLHSPNVVLKLAILTLVSLVPILARDRLKSLIGRAPEPTEVGSDIAMIKGVDDKKRWFQLWRARKAGAVELPLDVKEKEAASVSMS
ncbi:hypothetical protein BU17DRAFT_73378 [Hysterangium stoloniferum]|nr:hypothetical protein BU17DRAFT_73378 [Hysterangium stoloniferum]